MPNTKRLKFATREVRSRRRVCPGRSPDAGQRPRHPENEPLSKGTILTGVCRRTSRLVGMLVGCPAQWSPDQRIGARWRSTQQHWQCLEWIGWVLCAGLCCACIGFSACAAVVHPGKESAGPSSGIDSEFLTLAKERHIAYVFGRPVILRFILDALCDGYSSPGVAAVPSNPNREEDDAWLRSVLGGLSIGGLEFISPAQRELISQSLHRFDAIVCPTESGPLPPLTRRVLDPSEQFMFEKALGELGAPSADRSEPDANSIHALAQRSKEAARRLAVLDHLRSTMLIRLSATSDLRGLAEGVPLDTVASLVINGHKSILHTAEVFSEVQERMPWRYAQVVDSWVQAKWDLAQCASLIPVLATSQPRPMPSCVGNAYEALMGCPAVLLWAGRAFPSVPLYLDSRLSDVALRGTSALDDVECSPRINTGAVPPASESKFALLMWPIESSYHESTAYSCDGVVAIARKHLGEHGVKFGLSTDGERFVKVRILDSSWAARVQHVDDNDFAALMNACSAGPQLRVADEGVTDTREDGVHIAWHPVGINVVRELLSINDFTSPLVDVSRFDAALSRLHVRDCMFPIVLPFAVGIVLRVE
jgi:hypothetical protein